MNAMSVHNVVRVETPPERRMMKIRAEQKKTPQQRLSIPSNPVRNPRIDAANLDRRFPYEGPSVNVGAANAVTKKRYPTGRLHIIRAS